MRGFAKFPVMAALTAALLASPTLAEAPPPATPPVTPAPLTGVRIVLGPYVSFERLIVPQWWSIEEPGKRPVRFEVEGVTEVNAPAAAFSKTWLMAPVSGGDSQEPPAAAGADAPSL